MRHEIDMTTTDSPQVCIPAPPVEPDVYGVIYTPCDVSRPWPDKTDERLLAQQIRIDALEVCVQLMMERLARLEART